MSEKKDMTSKTRRQFLASSASGLVAVLPAAGRAAQDDVAADNRPSETFTANTASEQVSKWAADLEPALAIPCKEEKISAWYPQVRAKLREVLALPTCGIADVQSRILQRQSYGKITLYRVSVQSHDEEHFEAYIIEPADIVDLRPAWLCLHGNIAGGASSVTGLLAEAIGGRESLQRFEGDYARRLAELGYVTLSFDFPGFAARGTKGVPTTAMILRAMLLGKSYFGWCIANAMSALSLLRRWPTVRADRIGVTGFSMGGTLAAMLTAVDSRISAAAVSGRFPSWRERLAHGGMDSAIACLPGLLRYLDIPDILALAAPRPLFISQEVRNDFEKAHRLLAPVRSAYKNFDATERLTEYYDDTPNHRFVGKPLYHWIQGMWPACHTAATKSIRCESYV